MAVVGSAEVVVRAITNRVKQDIERAFNEARPSAKKAGEQAGKDYASGFSLSATSSVKDAINNAFSGTNAGANAAGRDAGNDYGDGAASGVADSGSKISGAAERAMGGAGSRGGDAFRRALYSGFADASIAASRAFTSIFAMANIGGVALAGMVSALSAIVSGLFAVAAAAGQAVGALAVLPGLMSVAAQAGGTLKLAFSGVGAALTAGLKPAAAAVKSTGAAAVSNANAIADAQKALGRARQDAAIAAADANRTVARANSDLARSEQELLDITKELNAARKEAAESLQQLGFDAEDAALAEDRAALSLEDAHAKLLAVQNLPADDRSRREAELSYKEAELAYRQAKDRNSDMAKEQKRAAKAGIEGSEEVRSVRERQAAAEEQVASAQRAVADAERARDRQRMQSARAVADAQLALQRAQQKTNTATAAAAAPVDAYAQALAGLSPAARTFVQYLVSIKDEFDGVKAAAGEELFPRLQTSIQQIVGSGLLDTLSNGLRETGLQLGEMALDISNTVTSAEGMKRIGNILDGNNAIMQIFTRENKQGLSAVDSLVLVFLRLGEAIQPVTARFSRWIAGLIRGWEASTRGAKGMDKLTGFFNKAGNRAALLGDIIGNLFGIFGGLGKAADKTGVGLLKSFRKWTRELDDFVNSAEGQDKLEKYFEGVGDNIRAISRLVRAVGRAFGKLGDNKGVAEFSDALVPAADNMGTIADSMTAAGGPFGDFLTNLTELGVVLADTGGIEIFFNVLNKALAPLVWFANTDLGGKFLLIVGGITAFLRALSFVGIVGKKVGQILIGGPIAAIRKLDGWFKKMRGSGKTAASGIDDIAPASDRVKAALERQMVTDKKKIGVLQGLETQALQTTTALNRLKAAGAPAAGMAATAAPGKTAAAAAAVPKAGSAAAAPAAAVRAPVANYVVPAPPAAATAAAAKSTSKLGSVAKVAMKPVSGLAKGFGALSMALLGISAPVAAVIAGVVLLVIGLKKLYGASPEFRKFVDGIVDKLKALGNWFKDILNKYVVPFMNSLFGWINKTLPKVGKAISGFMSKTWGVIKSVLGFISKGFGLALTLIKGYITKIFIPFWQMVWKGVQLAWKVIKPVLGFIWKGMQLAFTLIKGYITKVFIPYWQLVWKGIQLAWKIIKPVLGFLWKAVQNAFGLIKGYVVNILVPYIQKVWKVIQTMWGIAKKIFNALKEVVRLAFQGIKVVWQKVLRPVIEALKKAFQAIRDKVTVVVNWIKGRWSNFASNFGAMKDKVVEIVGKVKGKFDEVRDKVSDVVGKLRDKFTDLKGFLASLWDKVKTIVGNIKDKFAEIGAGVVNAFKGLAGKAVKPLNSFIRFLNDKLIDNVNKITGKFGLTIGHIDTVKGFQKGGYTGPGPANKVAGIVHADEFVVPKHARKKFEQEHPGALEHLRKTGRLPASVAAAYSGKGGFGWPDSIPDFGIGKVRDLAGDTIGGIKNVGEKIAKEGVGKVLETLIDGAKGAMGGAGIKRGPFLNDLFYGIMDSLADKARSWGGKEGAQPGGNLYPPKAGSGGLAPYNGPPGGWINPMGGPYRVTQDANPGHKPTWSIDMAAPSGTLVRAASAGNLMSYWAGGDSYGNTIKIAHADGSQTLYAHLLEFLKRSGRVKTGEIIGKVGSTGNSTGPHLHFELTPNSGSTRVAMAQRGVRLARGGVVQATPGGILATIGEAGRHERVEPLAYDGFSSRDRAIIDLIKQTVAANQGGKGDTYKIYPAPGMNEAELAQMVSRRVAWRRSVGT